MLPTPTVADSRDTANFRPDVTPYGQGYGMTLTDAARLLPTPWASDGEKGGPNQRGSKGDLALSAAVAHLLPTPRTSDSNGGGQHGSGGPDLRTAISIVAAADTDGEPRDERRNTAPGQEASGRAPAVDCGCDRAPWGRYAPAIHRWEQVTGRPAPTPVDENGRLAPLFVEWMQGLAEGHVTAVPGLSRKAMLKALGNGVISLQAAAALPVLAARAGVTA
jgi:hypothetical protein